MIDTVLTQGAPEVVSAAIAGDDVARDGSGTATIKEDRRYRLIHDFSYGRHTTEIIIDSPGVRAFTFMFG
jgi:hypothetical protein